MKRAVLALLLALMAFAAAAPLAEAALPCTQECTGDEPETGCSLDFCCSCCVHFRVTRPAALWLSGGVPASALVESAEPPRVRSVDPRRILHVPKSLLT